MGNVNVAGGDTKKQKREMTFWEELFKKLKKTKRLLAIGISIIVICIPGYWQIVKAIHNRDEASTTTSRPASMPKTAARAP